MSLANGPHYLSSVGFQLAARRLFLSLFWLDHTSRSESVSSKLRGGGRGASRHIDGSHSYPRCGRSCPVSLSATGFRSAKGEVGHPAACLAVRVASMLASVKERGYHKCVGVTMTTEPMLRSIILMVHSSVGAMVWWFSRGMLDNTFSVTCGYVRCE